jgi:glutamate--cysteine ligase
MLNALPAFWVGLLYDDAALEAAWALVKDWTAQDRQTLRDEVPVSALNTVSRGRTVRDIARDALAIARQGLQARGLGEDIYLDPLDAIIADGRTLAEHLLARYGRDWSKDADRIFKENLL